MSEQNQQPEVAAEEQQEAILQIQRFYVKKTFLLKRQIFLIFSTKNGNQNLASTLAQKRFK